MASVINVTSSFYSSSSLIFSLSSFSPPLLLPLAFFWPLLQLPPFFPFLFAISYCYPARINPLIPTDPIPPWFLSLLSPNHPLLPHSLFFTAIFPPSLRCLPKTDRHLSLPCYGYFYSEPRWSSEVKWAERGHRKLLHSCLWNNGKKTKEKVRFKWWEVFTSGYCFIVYLPPHMLRITVDESCGKIFPRKQHSGRPFLCFLCIQLCLPPPACGLIKVALLCLIVFLGHFCGGGRNILGGGTNFGQPQNTLVTFSGLLSFKCSTSKDSWSQRIITSKFKKTRWCKCWVSTFAEAAARPGFVQPVGSFLSW